MLVDGVSCFVGTLLHCRAFGIALDDTNVDFDCDGYVPLLLVYFSKGKIAKMLLDEANDFSCATTDVLAFKMLYLTSFF